MESKEKESTAIIQVGKKSIDLDDFKAMYYLLNAKPDTDIKVLTDNRKISLQDLHELNEKIHEKLRNHDMVTSMTKVTIVLSNDRVQEFSNWAEFERAKWDIPAHTESLSLTWEMNFLLPNRKLPQPHTLKLKLGSPLNPSEVFHLLMSKDWHEIRPEVSSVVCKIDFINVVLCNELFTLVTDWHSALPVLEPQNRIQKTIQKHPERIRETIRLVFLLSALLVLVGITHILLVNHSHEFQTNHLVERAYQWLAFSALGVYLMFGLGNAVGKWIVDGIGKIKKSPMFELTKGDKHRADEVKGKNNKLMREVAIKVLVSLIVLGISFFFDHIVNPLISLMSSR